jgi:MFS family permease
MNIRTKKINKSPIVLLVIILISYFAVGLPDGSFAMAWYGMEIDLGLTVAHSGPILVGFSVTYIIAGMTLGWLNKYMKLQTIYFWGLVILGIGFFVLALSPNFITALIAIAIYGLGIGMMASSMNSYMAKHFTTRHNNWMHCFWGGGAALSPVIMSQMMAIFSWRAGYFVLAAIVGLVGIILLVSMYKGIWLEDTDDKITLKQEIDATGEKKGKSYSTKKYLTKKWHQWLEILTFFFLGGTDYTLVFFVGIVLMERGLSLVEVALFPTVYYVSITGGRMLFGWTAKWLEETTIVRIGCGLAVIGVGVIYVDSNIMGMALTGLGLSPLLPTLVSDTSNRFKPDIISKLVGYEMAAFGVGIAVLFFMTSIILEVVSVEVLFPLMLAFIGLVFLCNEILKVATKNNNV